MEVFFSCFTTILELYVFYKTKTKKKLNLKFILMTEINISKAIIAI
jgi:hypothetical protein